MKGKIKIMREANEKKKLTKINNGTNKGHR